MSIDGLSPDNHGSAASHEESVVRRDASGPVAANERLHDEVPEASRYNAGMKYSLRSLMLDTVIAVPFLVAGAFAVCCIREVIQRYEEVRIINGIRFDWSLDKP